MTTLFIFVVALPVLMAVGMTTAVGRHLAVRAAWVTPLPALLLSLAPIGDAILPLDWLLLGGHVGLDAVSRTFLLFTALLWSVSGAFSRHYLDHDPHQQRFTAFFLVTLSGNLGLIVAQDLASFYAAFAVMTFGGYALVAHDSDRRALRAARIYLVLAVLGETMLLAAFILAASTAASLAFADIASAVARSPHRDLLILLLLGGFGIKAGAVPLHVWLPLAHPVAPTPASAVLSGSMIKAGLLGWIRFLPVGLVSLEGWGAAVLVAGLIAAFFGVAAGVTQRDAKTALAYSSISQMGFINAALGVGLASADAWPLALAAIVTYAAHHGLAKGALFLGTGVVGRERDRGRRTLALAGMLFAALAIAGAPLTSGAVAKEYLKSLAPVAPVQWPLPLDVLLGLAALGSTLLMARVLLLVHGSEQAPHAARPSRLWRSWVVLMGAVAIMVWMLPSHPDLDAYPPTLPAVDDLWLPIWPVAGGAMIVWLFLFARRRGVLSGRHPHIVAGDLLIPFERFLTFVSSRVSAPAASNGVRPVVNLSSGWYGIYSRSDRTTLLSSFEGRLSRWTVVGMLFALVGGALALLLAAVR